MDVLHSDAGRAKQGGTMLLLVAALLLAVLLCLRFAAPAFAASVTTVGLDDTGARTLAGSMVKDPGALRGASFSTAPPSGTPQGVGDALSFFPTNGTEFGVMTSGNAAFAGAENTQSNSGEGLGGTSPERGGSVNDVSVLKVDLTAPADANCLKLDFAFYSEEYPEYVGGAFNDAFIAELDKTTWSTSGNQIEAPDNFAFDPEGRVVSINSTGVTSMNDVNAGGTTYDGATVLLEAATQVTPGDHTLYLSIFDQGDGVYDSAAFVDNIRFQNVTSPEGNCEPGAQPVEGKTPLIVVPGIAGSQIVGSGSGAETWPRAQDTYQSLNDEHLLDLKLDQNGNDVPGKEGRSAEILRRVDVQLVPGLGFTNYSSDVYDTTIKALEANGYTLNENLYVFPYDWRKDTRTAKGGDAAGAQKKTLLEFIDAVREQNRRSDGMLPQVDIMAHSQGGLVTLSALRDQASEGEVRRVLTLGTPVLGATQALGVLQYRTPCFVERFGICFSNKYRVQEIFDTFPGAHQLLPSPNFDDAVGPPLVLDRSDRDDGRTGEQGYEGWSSILKEDPDRNDALIEDAKLFHAEQDQLMLADPTVRLARVVGSGVDTPEKIREYKRTKCSYVGTASLYCFDTVEHEIVKGNGDETVNLHSADLYNPQTLFDMRGTNDFGTIPNIYAPGIKHDKLPKDEGVLGFASAYFGNASPGTQAQASGAQSLEEPVPRSEADPRTVGSTDIQSSNAEDAFASDTENLAAGFGLSDAPQPVEGREIEIVGPAVGYVEDSEGRILGRHPSQPEGVVFQDIPGGTYESVGDTQTFFLNEDGPTFRSDFDKTGDEDLRLRIRDYAADEINGQAVFEVKAPAGAKINLDFSGGQALDELKVEVDKDGDGAVDEQQVPESVVTGPASSETDPPKTTATVEAAGAGQYKVTLSASDGPDGSGVAETRYYVEEEQEEHTYSGPFTVAEGATVLYWSVDKAGNYEQGKELVADAPTVEPETTIASGPSGLSNSRSATFQFSANVAQATFRCSLDGAPFAECSSPKEYTELPDGSHTFGVQAIDSSGNVDPTPESQTFTVDATAPSVGAPAQNLVSLSTLGTSTAPVQLGWSGSDAGSDVVAYELQKSTNAGAFVDVSLPTPTATALTPSLEPGYRYQFRVRAKDKAGNWSSWIAGQSSLLSAYQENHGSIYYEPERGFACVGCYQPFNWTRQAVSGAYGGYLKYDLDHGEATFTFTGREVAWVAPRATNRGKAAVWVDSVKVAVVDLYTSAGQPRKVVFRKAWASSGTHKVMIEALGTKNASSTNDRVDIDAFVTID